MPKLAPRVLIRLLYRLKLTCGQNSCIRWRQRYRYGRHLYDGQGFTAGSGVYSFPPGWTADLRDVLSMPVISWASAFRKWPALEKSTLSECNGLTTRSISSQRPPATATTRR